MSKLNRPYEVKYYCFKKKYYQDKIDFLDIFASVKYVQFLGESKYTKYMKKTPYFTQHIDLERSPLELKGSFSKRVRAKINQASRDGVEFKVYKLNSEEKINRYLQFCNKHIEEKRLLYRFSKRELMAFLDNYVVTYALHNGKILVMHGYIVDRLSGIVYAHESASHFRAETLSSKERNFISKANNLLHYEDMLFFKKQGIKIYDFGGYALNTSDVSLLNINRFKDGFRGKIIEQSHYESYLFFFITSLYHQIKPCVMKKKVKSLFNFFQSKVSFLQS